VKIDVLLLSAKMIGIIIISRNILLELKTKLISFPNDVLVKILCAT
jgi:hypothetical protein